MNRTKKFLMGVIATSAVVFVVAKRYLKNTEDPTTNLTILK